MFSGHGEGFHLEFCGLSTLGAGIGVEVNRLEEGMSGVLVMISGLGLASAEGRCRSVLCLEDSYMGTILFDVILRNDVTSPSVTTPLVKGGGEGVGTGGAPLLRRSGMAEALLVVVVSCDLLNKVVSEAVVFPKVWVHSWDSSVMPRREVAE